MDIPINSARPFYAWLDQLWSMAGKLDAARRTAQALQAQREASDTLRERIAQYEHQQPSYAADLRAALARQEAENARY
jgi:hypothetical protein